MGALVAGLAGQLQAKPAPAASKTLNAATQCFMASSGPLRNVLDRVHVSGCQVRLVRVQRATAQGQNTLRDLVDLESAGRCTALRTSQCSSKNAAPRMFQWKPRTFW